MKQLKKGRFDQFEELEINQLLSSFGGETTDRSRENDGSSHITESTWGGLDSEVVTVPDYEYDTIHLAKPRASKL